MAPSVNIKVVIGAGVIPVLVGVLLAISEVSGIWATFCILFGIAIILFGIGYRVTLYLGLGFLVASLVFLAFGLAPLLA